MGRIRVIMGWLKACQWWSVFPNYIGSGILILPSFLCEQEDLMVSGVSVKLEGNHTPGLSPSFPILSSQGHMDCVRREALELLLPLLSSGVNKYI